MQDPMAADDKEEQEMASGNPFGDSWPDSKPNAVEALALPPLQEGNHFEPACCVHNALTGPPNLETWGTTSINHLQALSKLKFCGKVWPKSHR